MLKVIDQGADDTTNAVSIRRFFARTAGVRTTDAHRRGHAHPDAPPHPRDAAADGQILVFQVPIPEPLRWLEPRETETRRCTRWRTTALMHVKLYEDIARHGHVATTYDYPVMVNGRYLMRPRRSRSSTTPSWTASPALQLFGAGREKRIYAVPPYTRGAQPRLRGPPVQRRDAGTQPCALCGAADVFLDEIVVDDKGGRMFVCSDTDYCARRRRPGEAGVG